MDRIRALPLFKTILSTCSCIEIYYQNQKVSSYEYRKDYWTSGAPFICNAVTLGLQGLHPTAMQTAGAVSHREKGRWTAMALGNGPMGCSSHFHLPMIWLPAAQELWNPVHIHTCTLLMKQMKNSR